MCQINIECTTYGHDSLIENNIMLNLEGRELDIVENELGWVAKDCSLNTFGRYEFLFIFNSLPTPSS
jgi:hypothetical protein